MPCSQCLFIRRNGKQCRIRASCRLGCGLFCWIHAGDHTIAEFCKDYYEEQEGLTQAQLEYIQKRIGLLAAQAVQAREITKKRPRSA